MLRRPIASAAALVLITSLLSVPALATDDIEVTLADLPSAPTNVRAIRGNLGKVRVSWEPPVSQGTSPITGYSIAGGAFVDLRVDASTRAANGAWGLNLALDGSVTVRADNASGSGAGATGTPGRFPRLAPFPTRPSEADYDFVAAAVTGQPGATAVLANLTMDRAVAPGYITADRCSVTFDEPQSKSSGNHGIGDAIANLGVIPLDADGAFCIYSQVPTAVIVDVQGTFSPSGSQRFTSVAPRRLVDTRGSGAPVPAGTITRIADAAPAGASAALVNITMTDGVAAGYATADRCSALVAGPQSKSTANHVAGTAIANLAVVPVDADGSFCIYNQSPVQIVVDTQGHFSSGAPLRFDSVTQQRLVDTRTTARPLGGQITRVSTGLPVGTTAALVNLTMVGADLPGYITADRCSVLQPGAQSKSSGNHGTSVAIANLAVVPLDTDGSFCIYSQQSVDIVVDLQGSFSATGQLGFTPLAPLRVLNTDPA